MGTSCRSNTVPARRRALAAAVVAAQSRVAERCASPVQAWDRSGSVNKSRAAESCASLAPAAAPNEYATDLITARRRAQWARYQDRIEPERLVFIDETWTRTNMAPLRVGAPRMFPALPRKPTCLTFTTEKRCDRNQTPCPRKIGYGSRKPTADVCFAPNSDRKADITKPTLRGPPAYMASKIFLRRRFRRAIHGSDSL